MKRKRKWRRRLESGSRGRQAKYRIMDDSIRWMNVITLTHWALTPHTHWTSSWDVSIDHHKNAADWLQLAFTTRPTPPLTLFHLPLRSLFQPQPHLHAHTDTHATDIQHAIRVKSDVFIDKKWILFMRWRRLLEPHARTLVQDDQSGTKAIQYTACKSIYQ